MLRRFIVTYLLWLSSFLMAFPSVLPDGQCQLIKPSDSGIYNFTGDNQYQITGKKMPSPFRVKVVDPEGNPVIHCPVYYSLITTPGQAMGAKSENQIVRTDSLGIATNEFYLGDKPGQYQVIAYIPGQKNEAYQVFTFYGRKTDWIFLLIIGLLGGFGLFLFGMNFMSTGLQKSVGDKMRTILSQLTHNRMIAVGMGAFVTMIIQSSSATTVMVVSFVNSRLMKFRQTIGVILGAAIGTTITAQLIAFKITDYSLLMIGVGFIMMAFTHKEKVKQFGEAILGFGLLFFGMYIMSEAMSPLRTYHPFIELLTKLEIPLYGILAGTVFTALIQSSSAFIGIMIVLASQGLLTLEASIPLLLGANIGTSVTAILASINTRDEAKQVALAHTLFKITGVLLLVFWIPEFAKFIQTISPKPSGNLNGIGMLATSMPRQIANAHTVFNVSLTLVILPFTSLFARFIEYILPGKERDELLFFNVKYLDKSMLKTPTLALNLAKQEILRMSEIVQHMLNHVHSIFIHKEKRSLSLLEDYEKLLNFLRDEIKDYLLQITRLAIEKKRVQEAFQLIYTIKELEQIGDIITKILLPKGKNWIESDKEFSEAGKQELSEYHLMTKKQISRAVEVFRDVNLEKAKAMKTKYKKYRNVAFDMEKQHYERLKDEVVQSVATSKTHLELINVFKRINEYATNIARIHLEWKPSQTE